MPPLPRETQSQDLIWRQPGWPDLRYDPTRVAAAVALARRAQGAVEGKLAAIGFEQRQEIAAETWTQEALSTAAIEGERLDLEAVRSSIARRLGVSQAKSMNTPRHVDGLLDVMDDAVTQADKPVTHERLHAWQAALFPTGYSGMSRIRVGGYREHAEPMQIVVGRIGRETVHYEAPPSAAVPVEIQRFLAWLDGPNEPGGLVKAALAHLWFETIHPFEDGNGRIGRAIVDLVLARDAGEPGRVLRISQQLLARRGEYYEQLERAQHGALDVTDWVLWFTEQVQAAFAAASSVVDLSLAKAMFWNQHRAKDLSPRQRKAINALLDAGPGGFEGGMSTRKYESLTGAARATASRDLIELATLGLLVQVGAGRGTRYYLQIEGWAPA
ncbi:MAG: Fic family protein [Rubrivivax sp.]|nr:Fic family protein [Rubrivivax sp.]